MTPIASNRRSRRRGRSATSLQVGDAHRAHLALLALAERVPRAAAAPARLDLDDDQRALVGGHEVDLAEPRAVVARDDLVAEPLEVLGGELLAERPSR